MGRVARGILNGRGDRDTRLGPKAGTICTGLSKYTNNRGPHANGGKYFRRNLGAFPRSVTARPLDPLPLSLFSSFTIFLPFFSFFFPSSSLDAFYTPRLDQQLNFKIRHRDEFYCCRGIVRIDLTLALASLSALFPEATLFSSTPGMLIGRDGTRRLCK